jgi:CBS domain-containing protein
MTPLPVTDLMLGDPHVCGQATAVDDARTFFSSNHVHMLLLTATGRVGEHLLGTVVRDDLPVRGEAGATALSYAHLRGRVVHADVSAEEARRTLHAAGKRRLAVVDDSGRLLGLLCLKRDGTGFCSDAGVRARRGHGQDQDQDLSFRLATDAR